MNPFESPVGASAPAGVFRSASAFATAATLALGAFVACDVLLALVELMGLATGVVEAPLDAGPAAVAYGLGLLVGGLGHTLFFLASAVTVAMWMYRAHTNLPALGAHLLDYTPAGMVGWWFVPVANLWKPYGAMSELWNASQAHRDDLEPAEGLLPIWWGLWITSNVLGNVSFRLSMNEDMLVAGSVASLFGGLVSAAAAVMAITVIRGVDRLQTEAALAQGM